MVVSYQDAASQMNGGTTTETDDQPTDVSTETYPTIHCKGTVALRAEAVVGLGFLGDIEDQTNIIQPDGFDDDMSVRLRGVEVLEGDVFVGDDEEYFDGMVVNMDDDIMDEKIGEQPDGGYGPVGIEYYDGLGSYAGTEGDINEVISEATTTGDRDLIREDVVELRASGRTGMRLLRQLDATGAVFAGEDVAASNDAHIDTRGLMERHPQHLADDVETPPPAVRSAVQLRDDGVPSDPHIFFRLVDVGNSQNKAQNADVFDGAILDDEGTLQRSNIVEPTDTGTDKYTAELAYLHEGRQTDVTDTTDDSGDTSPSNDSPFASAADATANAEAPSSYDELNAWTQSFVDDGVQQMESLGFSDPIAFANDALDDYETFTDFFEAAADGESVNADAETVADILSERLSE